MRLPISILSCITLAAWGMQPAPQLPRVLKPHETIIAFDLDDVVIQNRENIYLQWLAQHPKFSGYLSIIKDKYNLSDAISIVDKTAQEYPEIYQEAQEFKKVFTTASQIPGTIAIIHELADKKYSIVSASNMTTSTYQAMVGNKTLPPEFSKDFFFVATHPLNKKPDGKYYEKPAKEYYQNLVKYIHQKFPGKYKNFIFTDDKVKNSDAAQGIEGIKAIHFQNPEQFKQELKKLGVCLE